MAEKQQLDLSAFDSINIDGVQEAKKKGVVDIVFLIDTTGSMGPAIAQLAKNIATFISNIDPNLVKDWRVKVVSFGDLEVDRPEVSLVLNRPWTSDAQEIVNQLAECVEIVKEGGGGDEPESSLDALYSVIANNVFEEDWTERTRVVILFTDATPKPIKKETIGMELSQDEALNLLGQTITQNHVYTYIYAPVHADYETLGGFSAKFITYNPLKGDNPVEALRNLDFSETLKTLGKSVSVASTVS